MARKQEAKDLLVQCTYLEIFIGISQISCYFLILCNNFSELAESTEERQLLKIGLETANKHQSEEN